MSPKIISSKCEFALYITEKPNKNENGLDSFGGLCFGNNGKTRW